LSKRIITLVDRFQRKRSSWVIADQIIRAGTSIGANVVETQAASSKLDFVNFLNYAFKVVTRQILASFIKRTKPKI